MESRTQLEARHASEIAALEREAEKRTAAYRAVDAAREAAPPGVGRPITVERVSDTVIRLRIVHTEGGGTETLLPSEARALAAALCEAADQPESWQRSVR